MGGRHINPSIYAIMILCLLPLFIPASASWRSGFNVVFFFEHNLLV